MNRRTVSAALLGVGVLLALNARAANAAPVVDHNAGTWIDDYSDGAGLSSSDQSGVDPLDGRLKLTNSGGGFTAPFASSGTAITTTIMPTSIAHWNDLTISALTPAGTSLTVQVLDEGDTTYADAQLSGNETGLSGPSIDLSGLPVDRTAANHTGKFARIRLKWTLTTTNTAQTPAVDLASLAWTVSQGDLGASPLATTAWPTPNVDAQGTRRTQASADPVYQVVRWSKFQPADFGGMLTRGGGETIFNKSTGTLGSAMASLAALDRRDGAVIWERSLSGNDFSEIAHTLSQNGTLYIADLYNDILLAYDTTAGGALKWTHQFFAGHGNGRVAIGPDGSIYTIRSSVGLGIGTIYAFEPDGSIRWTRDILSGHLDPGYSQIVLGSAGELYFGAQTTTGGDGALYALDPATGTDLWTPFAIGAYNHGAPVVDSDGTIYIANESGTGVEKQVYAINPDGTEKWSRSIGVVDEYWSGLALRSDGLLLAERVSAFGSSTSGAIEAIDTATGSLSWSVPTVSDNAAFSSNLFVDGADGYFATTMLIGDDGNLSYVDASQDLRWNLRHDGGGAIAYFHDLMQDEDGALYGNLYSAGAGGNTVIAFSPWTLDACVLQCNLAVGDWLTVAVRSPMPAQDPLTGQPNQMQVLLDNGDSITLEYVYDLDGSAVWLGYYEIPVGMTPGAHPFIVQANAAGMTTDVAVEFEVPAVDSGNTGVLGGGTFGVGTDPCTPTQVCGPEIHSCGDGTLDADVEDCDDGNFVDGDGCSADCTNEVALGIAAQACVNAMNKAGSNVARAQLKLNATCLKAAADGGGPIVDCIADETAAKVEAAVEKVFVADEKCAEAPAFGYTGSTAVSDAARVESRAVVEDLFGAVPAVIAKEADGDGAACQAAVLKASQKIVTTGATIFLTCKKNGLAGKILPQMRSGSDLERCFDDVSASRVAEKGKMAKAMLKLAATIPAKCEGVSLSAAFPDCGSAPDVADCIDTRAECRICRLFNQMDGLAEDCDLFDDGEENASCP